MSIKDKMRKNYQNIDGGLFADVKKADVGDGISKLLADGANMMAWADPFFPHPSIPAHVKEAAIKAIEDGFCSHYTMPIGNPELRALIAKKIEKFNKIKVDSNRNIIINPGSDIGLLFAMTPFINPGDEVLVHDPSYPSNFLNPELLGGVTVKVPTYEKDNFKLDINEFNKRLTPKTKMVLLTSPNNPTGTVYKKDELLELSKFIVENDLICICDQAFEDTVFDEEFISIASLPGMWERTATVCSVSKGMGLSGFRVGYIFANDVIMDVYHGCAVNIQGATNTLAQLAVMPAFEDDSFIKDYVLRQKKRSMHAYEKFNSIPNVSAVKPESGFFSWVNVSKLGNSGDIVDYLVKTAKVICNDGKFYGDLGDGHFRIIHGSYNDEEAIDAINRVADALSKYKSL